MRFSLFAVLSGLAALAAVSALPADTLQRDAPPEDATPNKDCVVLPIVRLVSI